MSYFENLISKGMRAHEQAVVKDYHDKLKLEGEDAIAGMSNPGYWRGPRVWYALWWNWEIKSGRVTITMSELSHGRQYTVQWDGSQSDEDDCAEHPYIHFDPSRVSFQHAVNSARALFENGDNVELKGHFLSE